MKFKPGLPFFFLFFYIAFISQLFFMSAQPTKDSRSRTQGYRAGEDIPVYECVFRIKKDSVVKKGDGANPPIYIFPRKGEDFFHVLRKFPRPIGEEDIQPYLEESKEIIQSNSILRKTTFFPKGNLWIYSVAREEMPDLLEYFLSCE
jgi:hypothetical protein